MNWLRRGFLAANRVGYERLARPLIFRSSAQIAHTRLLKLLSWLDRSSILLNSIHRLAFESREVEVGGVRLPSRFILAAGLVKGEGFEAEADALAAVAADRNIIPGWRSVPRLVGLVEFGSFTRCSRMGNSGTVLWRDERTRSTQNRVGLKNPGAMAAAAFLSRHIQDLPERFGINIAVSPGLTDPEQEVPEVREAFQAFLSQQIFPTWFTLNVSCPNTADDPRGSQTEDSARRLCTAAIDSIQLYGVAVPLWIKVSPELSPEQYAILMGVFHEVGVRAVIATSKCGGGRRWRAARPCARSCSTVDAGKNAARL
jgi:dihydroorotate dehydrogenase